MRRSITLHTVRVPSQLGIGSRSTASGDAPTPSTSLRPLRFWPASCSMASGVGDDQPRSAQSPVHPGGAWPGCGGTALMDPHPRWRSARRDTVVCRRCDGRRRRPLPGLRVGVRCRPKRNPWPLGSATALRGGRPLPVGAKPDLRLGAPGRAWRSLAVRFAIAADLRRRYGDRLLPVWWLGTRSRRCAGLLGRPTSSTRTGSAVGSPGLGSTPEPAIAPA